jgi:microcystin-dependent protein
MDNFLGELMLVPWTYAPRGWAFCNGQLLSIAQNQALFSLLGTTYGGNGTTTFALPNLQGRVPVSVGSGKGLSAYNLGQTGGSATVTLTGNQIPPHTHTVRAGNGSAVDTVPAQNYYAATPAMANYQSSANVNMNQAMISTGGGSQPHENHMPSLVLTWVIALVGAYPSRN